MVIILLFFTNFLKPCFFSFYNPKHQKRIYKFNKTQQNYDLNQSAKRFISTPLICDIKTEDGIRDDKKELGENTLVYFRILLIFLIENISFVHNKQNKIRKM